MLCNDKSYEELEYIILEGVGRQGLKVKIVQYFFPKTNIYENNLWEL